uniref:Midgut cysteine proteinase 2 n=1 Tax=Rhipicephalus appendiculatus TaxID=34631 RepID=Q86GZ5_RHIAP|nr:midgut cysteine proteinase 2 [Rhipicephalus appendiculatus]
MMRHACIVLLLSIAGCLAQDLPDWGSFYKVKGVLYLPYAEIREPFTGYYDATQNTSRIDYYDGMVQTVQLSPSAPIGGRRIPLWHQLQDCIHARPKDMGVQSAPASQVNGTENAHLFPLQDVLPKCCGFTFVRRESCWFGNDDAVAHQGKRHCERFQLTVPTRDRVSKYTLWVSRDSQGRAVPRRYLMRGYNTLLGSHFDKYEVLYYGYSRDPVPPSVFDVTTLFNGTCRSFPGPGAERLALHNPMAEFLGNHDGHTKHSFEDFKETHKRTYELDTEHDRRRDIFRQNLRFIDSKNRANLGYNLAVNHLADRTREEISVLRGRLQSKDGSSRAEPFPRHRFTAKLPDQIDWRPYGAVTPVKDQAVCGSCWSFGTVGELEGAYFRKTGRLVRLSEQQLVDCSWNNGNNGCDGGEDFRAYEYIADHGLASDEDYGAYIGQDGVCHDSKVNSTISSIKSYVNITNRDDLPTALANVGPVSVSIDAALRSFSFYPTVSSMIPTAAMDTDSLDHSVLRQSATRTLQGEPYWGVKNSWVYLLGEMMGYVLISPKGTTTGGVATQGTYVEL